MSREIQLTRGLVAIVDDEDFSPLTKWAWRAAPTFGKSGALLGHYATRGTLIGGVAKTYYMHRQIAGAVRGEIVDHKDGNKLNNRRSNLRIATHTQNAANSAPRGVSGFRGVYPTPSGKFIASVQSAGKHSRLGLFETAEEAAHAYDEAARALHGEFARLNFPASWAA